jgi:acyl-CoA synthetase (AMP-forming)/AMP-acid ligase II
MTDPTGPEAMTVLLRGGDPARPALIVPEAGEVISYARLGRQEQEVAGRLAGLGVARGDRVALSLPNGPDLVVLLLAVTALGAAAAPLNPAYTQPEFAFYLEDLAPRLLLGPAGGAAAATAAAGAAGITGPGVAPAPGGAPQLDGPSGTAEFEPGRAADIALILHTSGTTSRPKQVPLAQASVMASARTIAAHYRLGPGDVSFCVMPLFHIHGLVASTFAALAAGGAVIAPRRFTPRGFWGQAREHGATWLSAGPTLHQMILDRADGAGPPPGLRFVRSCSSALSPALLARAEAGYGAPVLEAYGMTEASHQMASNPLPPAAHLPGSVGVPTGTAVRIISPAGEFLPEGSAGEVVIRGPGVFAGYAGNPQATAEAFLGDWFRTGDQGVFRDGYLFLEGRLKEMILRGGENIAPAEIEGVLAAHPSVQEAVCFGVPDEKYGELVGAVVTASGDADPDPKVLTDWCRERLAAFKVPARIDVLAEIPRTPTGKIQRRKVAELVQGAR